MTDTHANTLASTSDLIRFIDDVQKRDERSPSVYMEMGEKTNKLEMATLEHLIHQVCLL